MAASNQVALLGRIARLQGHFEEATKLFEEMNFTPDPNQKYFEIGMAYVASKNRKAAKQQYEQFAQLKSPLAGDLLTKINEMK